MARRIHPNNGVHMEAEKQKATRNRAPLARDITTHIWIGEQGAVRLDQVQALLSRDRQKQYVDTRDKETGEKVRVERTGLLSIKTAERAVRRWIKEGMVGAAYKQPSKPMWIWLTQKALDEYGLPYKYYEPKIAKVEHLYWINEARLWIEKHYPEDKWISERRLIIERNSLYPRTRNATRNLSLPHLPDGELERYDAEGSFRIAIEVEISPKKPKDIEPIVVELANTYPGIWYFINNLTQRSVTTAISKLMESKENFIIRHFGTLG